MPMQAESLEVLEQASVAPAQARAFVRAIEIEIAGAKDTLATKYDILLLRQDIDALRIELRAEFRSEISVLDRKLQVQIAETAATLRAEMAAQGAALREEMAALRATLREEMAALGADLKAEIHRSVGGVSRQMYTAILGQMAVLLGFAYFFATHLR